MAHCSALDDDEDDATVPQDEDAAAEVDAEDAVDAAVFSGLSGFNGVSVSSSLGFFLSGVSGRHPAAGRFITTSGRLAADGRFMMTPAGFPHGVSGKLSAAGCLSH